MYIFAYGSLVNKKSRERTLKKSKLVAEKAVLNDYIRKMNAPFEDGYLYLNIVPQINSSVEGIVIDVGPSEINVLDRREKGSSKIDISRCLSFKDNQPIYAYVQADRAFPNMKILQSYIDTCTEHLSNQKKKEWLEDTVIENEIIDDSQNPVYEFMA